MVRRAMTLEVRGACSNPRAANGHRWRQAKARLRAKGHGCWICRAFGRDDRIDYGLPARDPMSFSADHLVPVAKGGAVYDDANLEAAHLRCNEWRRDRSVAEVLAIARRARQGEARLSVTTDW